MGGKWSWVLATALGWAGGSNAWGQTPAGETNQPMPPMTAPSSETPASAAPAIPQVLATEEVPPRAGWHAGGDYLFWWIKRGPLPEQPLVTTAPQNSPNAGIFGVPGTQTLFGGSNGLDWAGQSGFSLALGYNFGPDGNWGIEGRGFLLPKQTINFSAAGNGSPLITRPFFDNLNNTESTFDVSTTTFNPPIAGAAISGSMNIQAATEFWGYELNLTHHVVSANGTDIDLYFGYRSLGLDENLQFNSDSTPNQAGLASFLGQPVAPGEHFTTMDFFGVTNRFYGPQVGAEFNWTLGRLTAGITGKVAAGIDHQTATINGESTLTQNGIQLNQAAGGFLAQPSNIGSYSRDVFCLVPELGLKLDFAVKPWLHLRCGYDVLYWSSVVRPGSQIDRNIDVSQVPTSQFFGTKIVNANGMLVSPPTTRPAFTFQDSDFWAQGFNFGVEIRY